MKKILFLVLLIPLLCSSKKFENFPITTTQTFNLSGNAKILSEKKLLIHLDTNMDYSIDTMKYNGLTKISFFNSFGELDSTHYFKMDTFFLSKIIYIKNYNKSKLLAIHYNRLGNKTVESKLVSMKDRIIYTKEYDTDTKKLWGKTWIKTEKSKVIWEKQENCKSKTYTESVYERDPTGNEIIIKTKRSPNKNQEYSIYTVKYLEWDTFGNWTKRIEYLETEMTGILTTRQITYYK